MSRSGYTDDCEHLNLYRGSVERAIRGKRGQAFLKEMAEAMDAMPEKVLIADEIVTAEGDVCGIGSVAVARGMDVSHLDPQDPHGIAKAFGIAYAMAAEIEYMNDEWGSPAETPEHRWTRMRKWVSENIHGRTNDDA